MTVAYFILEELTTEALAQAVDVCLERYEATPIGGVAFHGNTVALPNTARGTGEATKLS